ASPALLCAAWLQGWQPTRGGARFPRGAVVADLSRAYACPARPGDRCGSRILSVKRLRVGVVGAGAWGRNHVRTVAGLAEAELAGHLLVYHPAAERLRELVQNGELGRVFYLYGLRVNLGQVRKDENALWSFGPHDVSVALYLLGEQPVRVAAHGKSYLQPAIEDVVFLTMEFASGVLAHVQMSWLDPHKERKLTVVGAKKMVVFDDMEPREKLRIYDKGVDRPPEYGSFGESLAIREGDIFIPRIPTVEPLAAELAHFVRAAQGLEAPRASAEDGVRV